MIGTITFLKGSCCMSLSRAEGKGSEDGGGGWLECCLLMLNWKKRGEEFFFSHFHHFNRKSKIKRGGYKTPPPHLPTPNPCPSTYDPAML